MLLQPKATLKFPLGEVSFENKVEEEEVQRMLSISGIVKGQFFNGACTAQYNDGNVNLRYSYKVRLFSFCHPFNLYDIILSFTVIKISFFG